MIDGYFFKKKMLEVGLMLVGEIFVIVSVLFKQTVRFKLIYRPNMGNIDEDEKLV